MHDIVIAAPIRDHKEYCVSSSMPVGEDEPWTSAEDIPNDVSFTECGLNFRIFSIIISDTCRQYWLKHPYTTGTDLFVYKSNQIFIQHEYLYRLN